MEVEAEEVPVEDRGCPDLAPEPEPEPETTASLGKASGFRDLQTRGADEEDGRGCKGQGGQAGTGSGSGPGSRVPAGGSSESGGGDLDKALLTAIGSGQRDSLELNPPSEGGHGMAIGGVMVESNQARLAKPSWPKTPPSIPSTLYKFQQDRVAELTFDDIVKPVPVIKRPFEAILKPYPGTACSRLCNHPMDKEIKQEYLDVLKKSRDNRGQWASSSFFVSDEQDPLARRMQGGYVGQCKDNSDGGGSSCGSSIRGDAHLLDDDEDRIPEELLLKYTRCRDSPTYSSSSPSPTAHRSPPSSSINSSRNPAGPDAQSPPPAAPESPEEDNILSNEDAASKPHIVLDMRKTKSSENLAKVAGGVDLDQEPAGKKRAHHHAEILVSMNKGDFDDESDVEQQVGQQTPPAARPHSGQSGVQPEPAQPQEERQQHQSVVPKLKQGRDLKVGASSAGAGAPGASPGAPGAAPAGPGGGGQERPSRKDPQVAQTGAVAPPVAAGGPAIPGKPAKPDKGKNPKGKKKRTFARHKIRSESPDKEFYDVIDDPAETQVATSDLKRGQSQGQGQGDGIPGAGGKASGEQPGDVKGTTPGTGDNEADNQGQDDEDHGEDNQSRHRGENEDDEDNGTTKEHPRSSKGAAKENPLDRRALLMLEKQLQADRPDSKFDMTGIPHVLCIRGAPQGPGRLQELDERLIKEVRNGPGRAGSASAVENELRALEKELALPSDLNSEENEGADFWLHIPRTFSYQAARFELPLNLETLNEMSPLDYLARNVSVSSSRRQLYDKVFIRHRSLKDGMLNEASILTSLEEAIGSTFTEELTAKLWDQLGYKGCPLTKSFSFKEFCGVAAMVERLYCQEFIKRRPSSTSGPADGGAASGLLEQESKSEIEIADFDRLLTKLEVVQLKDPAMKKLLILLKASGLPSGSKTIGTKPSSILARKKSQFEFL